MKEPPSRLWRLCRKELRETLRDRRTILTLVLMPLLLYPLLGMTLQRFLLSASTSVNPVFMIGMATEREGKQLRSMIEDASLEVLAAGGTRRLFLQFHAGRGGWASEFAHVPRQV